MPSASRPANQADFTFEIDQPDTPALRVTGFRGQAALSTLFHVQVDLASDEPALDKAALLGQACRLTLRSPRGDRFISGIVRALARTGQGSRVTHYAAEIVPVHWYLTRRQQSRILQSHLCTDMSVPGVIQHVLEKAGIPDTHFRFALQGTYPQRECVVQYRETDMNFIARLMEIEGLHFFFEHEADRHVLVIADGDVAHVPGEGIEEIAFRAPTGLVPAETCAFELEDRRAIEVDAVSLDDFDFKNPAQQLRARLEGPDAPALETVDYPGCYVTRGDGERYARVRLEAEQVGRHVVRLRANVRGLRPGSTFHLVDHPAAECNREYLVIAAEEQAAQPQSVTNEAGAAEAPQYRVLLTLIPVEVPYRAPLDTPVPRVAGSQTALVVGPPGEEIWPDEYGRVKVQFHWDQAGTYNEESSAWIRVSQGWAGGRYGMFFLPRVGQEVVVDFLEANPDRPLITGSVYNKDNMPPVQLPEDKTCSTIKSRSTVGGGGANELRFDDRKDEELLFLHAQKNLHLRALNDAIETIGANRHSHVSGDVISEVSKNVSTAIELDRCEQIGGNASLSITGDQIEVVSGNQSVDVGGGQTLTCGGTVVVESSTGITLKVGGNFLTIDPSGIYLMGTVVHVNGAGAALNGTSLEALETGEAAVAATTEPGTDVTYQADPDTPGQIEATLQQVADADEDQAEDEASWVEIELVDQNGLPVAGEAWELISPSGKTYSGSLDANGRSHVAVDQPGTCQVSFPRLDRRAWSRTGGEQAAATAAGGATQEGSA